MLDLTLFRKPAFNGVSAVAFCLSAGMFAMFLYLTIYMQGVLDYSPLEAGLRFLPLTVLGFIVAPISGALSQQGPDPGPARDRAGPGRGRAAAHARRLGRLGAGRRCWPASSSPASASASPTRGSARRRSRSCRWRNRGWARGSTRPSARSGSRPGSPALGADLPVAGRLEAGRAAAARARTGSAKSSPRAARAAVAALTLPPAIHAKAVHAADVAFVSGFNEILLIAAILSFVGAALGFALVRSSDFVQPTGGPPSRRRRSATAHIAKMRA